MPVIEQHAGVCTVVVTVDGDSQIMPELEAHARDGLLGFRDMAGFISGALHKSNDGGRLVQYLQWKTEADHFNCMNDSRWDELPSTRQFMQAIESGRAIVDVRIYRVIAATDAT